MTDVTATARTLTVPAGVSVHNVQLFAGTLEIYLQLVAEHGARERGTVNRDGRVHRWARWTADGVPYVLYPPVRSEVAA